MSDRGREGRKGPCFVIPQNPASLISTNILQQRKTQAVTDSSSQSLCFIIPAPTQLLLPAICLSRESRLTLPGRRLRLLHPHWQGGKLLDGQQGRTAAARVRGMAVLGNRELPLFTGPCLPSRFSRWRFLF